ncbi:sigma-54-dependent transcriptional regulator [Desulfobaculum sp.]
MRILLVDDDAQGRAFLADYLNLLGHAVTSADCVDRAVQVYRQEEFDLVLSDISMPGATGIDLIGALRGGEDAPGADIVLYTGHIDVQLAIQALRAGAYDYLTKPINLEELGAVLDRVEEHMGLRRENRRLTEHFDDEVRAVTQEKEEELEELRSMLSQQAEVDGIGIFSPAMWQVVHQAEQYHTDRSVPVLIQGETGVGKEIVAKIVHYGREHTTLPFVGINCAAISPNLFESELFGYEPGAFTGGANRGKRGKLDIAKGGSLFLDEIAEIPVELQAKLLRVIEENQFYRVGGLKKHETDIRIIAATNLDFEERMEKGLFRRDLFYRLNVGQIIIPPLRERREDIVPLAKMFLDASARKRGRAFADISDAAQKALLDYHWPGNVRELKNAMEWVTLMHDAPALEPSHFVHLFAAPRSTAPGGQAVPEAAGRARRKRPDNAEVLRVLEACGGNKTHAARKLGISLRTLYYRLERMEQQGG